MEGKTTDYTQLEKQIINDREERFRKELKPLAEEIRKVYLRAGLEPTKFMKDLRLTPFHDGYISIGFRPNEDSDNRDMEQRLIKKFIKDMEVNIEDMENIKNSI